MINKGANDWNVALRKACGRENMEVIKLLIDKGTNDWDRVLTKTRQNNLQNIVDLVSKFKNQI